jgi:hypothetical protein
MNDLPDMQPAKRLRYETTQAMNELLSLSRKRRKLKGAAVSRLNKSLKESVAKLKTLAKELEIQNKALGTEIQETRK